jgi:hypothetical protein
MNSRDFGNLDTGYRGWISRLKMFVQALSLEDAIEERKWFGPCHSNMMLRVPTSFIPEADCSNALVEVSDETSSLSVPTRIMPLFGSSTLTFPRFFLMGLFVVAIYFVLRRGGFRTLSGVLTSRRATKAGTWTWE